MLRSMTNPDEQLIERFYAAFDAHDGDTMAACYAPGAHFSDPVFPDLNGDEPGAMWRMLTTQAGELRIELLEREAAGGTGSAHWRAHYVFTKTGRPVVNDIHARFRFAGGLIADHTEDFSFYRWSRQALGTSGRLLGWTPVLRAAVRRQAAAQLASFMQGPSQSSSA